MKQELETVEKEVSKEEVKLKIKRVLIKNWDYITFILTTFGLILIITRFWETETILWNRIKYTTGSGSQWQNAAPIYMNTPLVDLIRLLNVNIAFYIIGNGLIIISAVLMVYQYYFKRKWFKTSKYTLIVLGMTSFLAFFTGFWMKLSVPIIADLGVIPPTVSGYEWIRIDIGVQSLLIEILSIIVAITASIIFGLVLGAVIRRKIKLYKRRKKALLKKMEGKIAVKENRILVFFKDLLKNLPFYIILIGYLIFTLFPVFLAVRASMSTPFEIMNGRAPRTPLDSAILNYSSVMFAISEAEPSFRSALFRSLFLGFGTSLFGLAISVSSGYGLARLKFKGKSILSFMILSTQMFPAIILLIPQYVILSQMQGGVLGLIFGDYFWLFGLLLVMATGATAYVTWMMKGYFETIPVDIEEAALIDGYGRFSAFTKIALPLAKSGIVAVMVFTFLSAWQEFVLARTFLQDSAQFTLPLLFYNYQNLSAPDTPTFFELLSPYSVLVAIPVVIFYMLLQRQLVGGVTAGSIK